MYANREPYRLPGRRHAMRLFDRLVIVGSVDDQRLRDACAAGSRDHGIEIGGELLAGEVAVGVDHLTRVPGGTSPSNATSVGLPPSGLAASTIPFDSMPISFAGFRLKTIAIVRPTNCS